MKSRHTGFCLVSWRIKVVDNIDNNCDQLRNDTWSVYINKEFLLWYSFGSVSLEFHYIDSSMLIILVLLFGSTEVSGTRIGYMM